MLALISIRTNFRHGVVIGHRAILARGIHDSKLTPLVFDLVLKFLDRSELLVVALLRAALGWVLSPTLLLASGTSLSDHCLFVFGKGTPLVNRVPAVFALCLPATRRHSHGRDSELCVRELRRLLHEILEKGYAAGKILAEVFVRHDTDLIPLSK